MATTSLNFSYTGQFKPGTSGAHLHMENGILADVGYTVTRDYYISRMAASWRSGSLAAGSLTVNITIDNVDSGFILTISSADIASGYKVGAASSLITIAQNEHLGAYAEAADASDYLEDLTVTVELDTVADVSSSDDVLTNITITTTDLKAIRPDIEQFLFPGETDFSKAALQAKKELYAELKGKVRNDYPDYTNAELDTFLAKIKDLPKEECLKQRLKYMVVAIAFRDSRLFNEAEVYATKAKAMPLQYYIDDDADDAADDDEYTNSPEVTFGR